MYTWTCIIIIIIIIIIMRQCYNTCTCIEVVRNLECVGVSLSS